MIEYNFMVPLFLLIGLGFIIFFFIVFLKRSYYLAIKEKYSFMNRFPFEAVYQKYNALRTFFFILLSVLTILLLTIIALYISTFKIGNSFGYAIFVGILFILNIICALALFFVTPKNYLLFKIYSVLAIIFGILANATLGILSMAVYSHYAFKIVGGFAFLISVFNVCLALNPRLKDWDKLFEDVSSDGTIVYVRPKVSHLAFTLWLNFLSIILGEVLILINMILTSNLLG